MLQQTKPISAALYCRLSRDDDGDAESQSIQTQREMLSQYAKEKGYEVFDWYVDDGWTGTNFERPSFKRMIDDIGRGHVNTVITKDLSRLGRNYLEAGKYIEEFFPENGIRYIAINDSVDTKNGYNEFASLKNMFNDWYSMDISRKIRAAYKTRAKQGLHTIPYAPYGYLKDPDNRYHIIPDPETAPIVQRIFNQAAQGMGMTTIANGLSADSILVPRAYLNKQYGVKISNNISKYPYHWSIQAIKYILGNTVYLGKSEQCKSTAISHKNRKRVNVPKEKWITVLGTHEPLVDEAIFELAAKRIAVRKRNTNDVNINNIFAGLLRCADCNNVLVFNRRTCGKRDIYYSCTKHKSFGKKFCSAHHISFKALNSLILEEIHCKSALAAKYENKFLDMLMLLDKEKRYKEYANDETDLFRLQSRSNELDTLFSKIYEDNVLGRLSDERYVKMSRAYEQEQKDVLKRIEEIKTRIAKVNDNKADFKRFSDIVKKYINITELTPKILNELIEKIVVHECEYINGERKQQIDVYYNFVGILSEE